MTERSLRLVGVVAPTPRRATSTNRQSSIANSGFAGLGIKGNIKRNFYFEQAAHERWSTRELLRKIDGALFERFALARDTKGLVALEKKKARLKSRPMKISSKTPTA
jgi:hypothetical protein